MKEKWAERRAFTIVELLIVIVVIAILAAITVVAYTGIQARAKDASIQTSLRNAVSKIEAYKAVNGQYPTTQSVAIAEGDATGQLLYVDANCYIGSGNTVKTSAWIPNIDMALPQSDTATHSRGQRGCYVYQSDGDRYLLAAWNAINTGPQSATFYRRIAGEL
ncbi:type II secretion system GspH family protein [Candidatus Saccharibacteria bacterium]|nr:type II secretion system GspH family protein [Candidatus Saccharibacteria bacterium]